MKIKYQPEYKSLYTLEDMDKAKIVIANMKEDTSTAKEYAAYAVREALRKKNDYLVQVIQAEAETSKNYRADNNYGEGSGNMDTWIEAIAETGKGFIRVGAYLTDIWNIDGETDYTEHMYIKYYTEA